MVNSTTSKSFNNNNNEGWGGGMGLLFIFFHNNNNNHPHDNFNNNSVINNNNKRKSSSFLSSSSSSNLLLSRTQSTLSICALLLFTTLLLFTLLSSSSSSSSSTIIHRNGNTSVSSSRRLLKQKSSFRNGGNGDGDGDGPALQGIGELYLRGSKAMSDLIVSHVSEDATVYDVRTFVRVLMHSGLLSRVDVVFVFPSLSMAAELRSMIKSECDSLIRLVRLGEQLGRGELGPGLSKYLRPVGDGGKEPLWGRRGGGGSGGGGGSLNSTSVGELTRPSYGSVVGFEASELDPEDTLSGFLDHVPMKLRRWACYPMLLGRVRRNYKHVMLVDAKTALVVSDPFTRVRNRTAESVYLWSNPNPNPSFRHGRKNSNPNPDQKTQVNPGVLIGGTRGLRRFTNAALTEIVRVSIDHKGKNRNSVTESSVVNQLVHSGHLLKTINMISPTGPIPDSGALVRFNSGSESGWSFMGLTSEYFSVVQRVNSGGFNVDTVVMREICLSHKLFTSLYSDCFNTSTSKSSSKSS